MARSLYRIVTLASLFGLGLAQGKYPFDVTSISAPDGSVTAKFVSIGATLTEFWAKDRKGVLRDLVLGYDDNSELLTDSNHPLYGPIAGRHICEPYCKRNILDSNFQDTRNEWRGVPTNDHDGADTLHGGLIGWDRRNWTLVSKTPSSVVYQHIDKADEGFPGTVTARVTYTLANHGVYSISINAKATQKTPIMLTSHTYWNLDAFQGSNDIFSHELSIDASRVIEGDSNQCPTGNFINVGGNAYDFRVPQKIGARFNQTLNYCGPGCTGYDNAWIYDKTRSAGLTLYGPNTGIKMTVVTDQPAVQVYTGNWLGSTPRKAVHGGPTKFYEKWSAVAVEQEGYIDAIHHPEWKVDQIYGPGRDYEFNAVHVFSTS
ncbi:hypothetical protein BOTBODRAFT_186464 [Botryobasidium botryosum FD-172 SS1]|uniref:Aldose 1-epimerase n=1 Tax=Botryobasidium botryosum (strain FD-172 SS1) TaxID=930990 RepID=A0A067MMV5_BOTB1|nr:hypothetical protein BOTBODRAFT_186464 [Botryobasidium botryosum FD-172 SS1]